MKHLKYREVFLGAIRLSQNQNQRFLYYNYRLIEYFLALKRNDIN
jgi:hypothetical protein